MTQHEMKLGSFQIFMDNFNNAETNSMHKSDLQSKFANISIDSQPSQLPQIRHSFTKPHSTMHQHQTKKQLSKSHF